MSDEKFMHIALELAKINLGLTAPNPSVGCVIVKNNKIIATATTAQGGRPHAEFIAINKVKDKSQLLDATLYVTLEPCCHFGETPPCVDLIITNKIKKVVIANIDIYKKVNGGGIAKLREASIDVVCGVLEDKAHEVNKAFFKKQKTGLPYITLKLATSLDGKIATKNFDSKWISSERSRLFAHFLRAQNDTILVGANTIKNDNPTLDCRISGLENHSPKKIIISNKCNFDLSAKIFQNKIPTIILTSNSKALNDQEKIQKLENIGAKIILCEEKNSKIDLLDALTKIAQNGVNSVLVEGGKNIATQFLQQNLVDELVWIRSNKIIGEDGISAIGELGFSKVDEVLKNFKISENIEMKEGDLVCIYRKL